ncbi:MAG: hypothetical protein NTX61_08785 [Bacteroidetes bacterium]|nr:hypothetical protein [Bacteroidota bacterium]
MTIQIRSQNSVPASEYPPGQECLFSPNTGILTKDTGSSGNPEERIISGNFSFNNGHGTLCETWDNGFVIATGYGRNGMYIAKTSRSFDLTWSFNYVSNIGYVGGIAES